MIGSFLFCSPEFVGSTQGLAILLHRILICFDDFSEVRANMVRLTLSALAFDGRAQGRFLITSSMLITRTMC